MKYSQNTIQKFEYKLGRLRDKNPFLFLTTSTRDIAKKMNITLEHFSTMLRYLGTNTYKERDKEFLSYVYSLKKDDIDRFKIAKDIGYAPNSIDKLFRRVFGMTLSEFKDFGEKKCI